MSKMNYLFRELINNAIDFFNQALIEEQIHNFPKYALINFASGFELILKARLMSEHWTLILTNPKEADISKFENGNFVSINLDEAISRIKSILGEDLTAASSEKILAIKNYRNKLIHFCEPAYLNSTHEEHDEKVKKVIREILKYWKFLYERIQKQWGMIFKDFEKEFADINRLIKKTHSYLTAMFDQSKRELQTLQLDGIIILKCPLCNFSSLNSKVNKEKIPCYVETICLTCEDNSSLLLMNCFDCGEVVAHSNDNKVEIVCRCTQPHDLHAIIYESFKDILSSEGGKHDSNNVCCSYCKESLVIEDNGYFCLLCLIHLSTIFHCKGCGTPYATDSYLDIECGVCAAHWEL